MNGVLRKGNVFFRHYSLDLSLGTHAVSPRMRRRSGWLSALFAERPPLLGAGRRKASTPVWVFASPVQPPCRLFFVTFECGGIAQIGVKTRLEFRILWVSGSRPLLKRVCRWKAAPAVRKARRAAAVRLMRSGGTEEFPVMHIFLQPRSEALPQEVPLWKAASRV